MKFSNLSFAADSAAAEQVKFPVTLKNASGEIETATDAQQLAFFQKRGFSPVPENSQTAQTGSRPVSRSRTKTSRSGALSTSRKAQANSLRVPDWAIVGNRYPAKVVEFQDIFEVVNGVKAETPKYSQTKFSTVVDGQEVQFSALFSEKHPEEGQEVLLVCVADTTGRAVSGKQWEVA